MKLLIAEDETDLAEALTAFFERNHFTVDAVHDGLDAYEYASSGGYDAVILDIMMPKMDGIPVLERLRAENVKTPVMMLTAKGEKDDRITGFNAGALRYGRKTAAPSRRASTRSGCSTAFTGPIRRAARAAPASAFPWRRAGLRSSAARLRRG